MRAEPKELQIYKHFKGNLYQIITIAIHSETSEKLVIYRPLYKDAKVYARPLAMFLSEVDHKKYPEVTQKYRFELMGDEEDETAPEMEVMPESEVASETETTSETETAPASETEKMPTPEIPASAEDTDESATDDISEMACSEGLDPLLERFLDADSFEAKLNVFYLMKKKATRNMLSYVAMSLDLELSKEDPEEQYLEILNCLKTMEKFECNRLRP